MSISVLSLRRPSGDPAPPCSAMPPALVADFVEGLHDGGPVVVALEELDVETGPLAGLVGLRAGVLLDVEGGDPLAEDADPLFGPAVVDEVAAVEVPADLGGLEFVDVAGCFEGAEQEIVPDVLDGDPDAEFLGEGDGLADLVLGTLVGVGVADGLIDDGGDQEDEQVHRSVWRRSSRRPSRPTSRTAGLGSERGFAQCVWQQTEPALSPVASRALTISS